MIGGCSVLLDGSTGYVDLGTLAARDFTSSDFSLLVWAYLRSLPGSSCFAIGHGATNTSGYSLEITSAGEVRFRTNQAGANTNVVSTTAPVDVEGWYHLAAVKIGATGYGYVNGELVTSGALSNPVASGGSTSVGANSAGAAQFLDGAIDEPAFFNRGLTQEQIRELMWAKLSSSTPGIVSLHHFDDGLANFATTNAAAAASIVGGTLTGGASWVFDRWAPWIEPRVSATSGLTISSHVAAAVPGTLRNFIPRVASRILVSAQLAARVSVGGTGYVLGEILLDGVARTPKAALSFPAGIHRTSVPLFETIDLEANTVYSLALAGRRDAAGSTISVVFDSPSTGYAVVAQPVDGTW